MASYLALSLATVVAVVLLRHTDAVTPAVWTRSIIVAATAALLTAFAAGAVRGHARAYLRLRISSALMFVAVVVIVALPGAFPMWLRAEQALCGLLLLGVVALANRRDVRALFARRG